MSPARIPRTESMPVPAGIEPEMLPPLLTRTPPGMEKCSAVLLRFAEPLLQDVSGDYEDLYRRIAIAVHK